MTLYEKHPQKMAEFWRTQGATRLHIVNLDGAFSVSSDNREIVREIVQKQPMKIQLGGGIRTLKDAAEWLELGVSRIIVGTVAVTNPDLLDEILKTCSANKVIVGLDARRGRIAIQGWEEMTAARLIPTARSLEQRGVVRVIYTDISRDGAMTGPDFSGTEELCRNTTMKIIASGGFATLEHFKQLSASSPENLEGAVVGKALYEKKVAYRDLVALSLKKE